MLREGAVEQKYGCLRTLPAVCDSSVPGRPGKQESSIRAFLVSTTPKEHIKYAVEAMDPAKAQDLSSVVKVGHCRCVVALARSIHIGHWLVNIWLGLEQKPKRDTLGKHVPGSSKNNKPQPQDQQNSSSSEAIAPAGLWSMFHFNLSFSLSLLFSVPVATLHRPRRGRSGYPARRQNRRDGGEKAFVVCSRRHL